MQRLLITGAAGGIGSALRERLFDLAPHLRLSDRALSGEAKPHEELVECDLADQDAVTKLVQGCDGIIHLGGHPVEGPWDTILDSNIRGAYHIYEAARLAGCRRILFASSSHAVGFYPRTQRLETNASPRPDTLYGLSKVFGENLGQLYWDKFGIESVALRIGACFDRPKSRRHLPMFQSYDDMARLARAVFAAEHIGFTIMYGVSDNDQMWWDNGAAAHVGYRPQDNSAAFAQKIAETFPQADPNDDELNYQGGPFTMFPHPDD